MALAAGTRLGIYEILSVIGAGGMGEVYRARDTKLGRDVAVKILPESFAHDPDRLARFEREATTLASLNHPNIASIYGFEESAGVQALVLELVDGPTLADLIREGPLPLDESLRIARQIVEALEAARDQGVIHRDLKPANIKVRPDGMVKVLDFGLAKIGMTEAAGQGLSQSPTQTVGGTHAGMILGTAAYMSPEQARGMPIDTRTDVWAFGCVLYEMLSGRSAFGGPTIPDTIVKILDREPDWRVLPVSTPRSIRELLRRCVRKDQQFRLQDISVARIEIDEARAHLSGRRSAVGLRVIAVGVTAVLTILSGLWWQPWKSAPLIRSEPASIQHQPVTVVIADFQNSTGDPAFDRTLELMIKRALDGAGFINAYDRSVITRIVGVRPSEKLDEVAARELAVKHGLGVVVSGSIDRQGNGYEISMKATQTVTGNVMASEHSRASSKEQVVGVAIRLATRVRKALGDAASESDQMVDLASLTATSLDVARLYAAAQEAVSNGKPDEALTSASNAVALDPKFGVGYQLLAVASRNLGHLQNAERYINVALRYPDGMTDRERLTTRAFSYRLASDWQQCVKAYGELLGRYPADPVAYNQRALCSSQMRNLRAAMDDMRRVVEIAPKRAINRENLALYSNYASEFQAAEREARAVQEPDVYSTLARAFAQLGQGLLTEAARTYEELGTMDKLGASLAASGLGDLAIHEGRFSDAVRILNQGAAADLSSKYRDRAARKFAALAYAHLLRGQRDAALKAVEKAFKQSQHGSIRFLVAKIFVDAGELARARTVAARLSLGLFGAEQTPAEPAAYAKIIEGEIALKNGDPRQAIKLLTDANMLYDTWLGHFDLGRAYLEVRAFAGADAQFSLCIKRRGEAISLFLDEEPTYGFFPPVYYYQGQVREGLASAGLAGLNESS